MDEDSATGCTGCLALGALGVLLLISGCVVAHVKGCCEDWRQTQMEERRLQEEAEAREAEARELAERARKAEEVKAAREEKLRVFSLKEAPLLWKTYQNLQAEIASQDAKIEDLRKTLVEFEQDPDQDADFRQICSLRDQMVAALKTMHAKMEDAYLASRKFAATPSRKDYDELRRKHLEDGLREAEAAVRKFNEMRAAK